MGLEINKDNWGMRQAREQEHIREVEAENERLRKKVRELEGSFTDPNATPEHVKNYTSHRWVNKGPGPKLWL